jgi:hypothetical protein
MNDMNTPDGELENTEIETSSGAVGGAVPVGNFRFGASYRGLIQTTVFRVDLLVGTPTA